MRVKSFEDLGIWKEARRLTTTIYRITSEGKFSKDFALRDQIRRAVISSCPTSLRGLSEAAIKNSSSFFTSLKGSVAKSVRNSIRQWIKDISWELKRGFIELFRRLSSRISGLINSLKSSGMKGAKYHYSAQSSD